MLPKNTHSAIAMPSLYLQPDDRVVTPFSDYELGGVALNDASRGLMVKVWHCWVDQFTVWLQAEGDGTEPIMLFQEFDLTEISFCFDQNMRYCVAYVQGGVMKLRWWDSIASAYVTTVFTAARTPKLAMDDKRYTQLNKSDMILAYIRDNKLCYRQQRDRFQNERVLRDDLYAGTRLKNIGMGKNLRMQFELT